jgi:predicted small lipoprotein YifL
VHLLSIVIIFTALLSACGTKGPLYLPQDNPPPQSSQDEESNQ